MQPSVLESPPEIANTPYIWYTAVPRLGCFLRLEGSVWRSGSTYLAKLTPGGKVLVHAKNMTLSCRQLKPSIYGHPWKHWEWSRPS